MCLSVQYTVYVNVDLDGRYEMSSIPCVAYLRVQYIYMTVHTVDLEAAME